MKQRRIELAVARRGEHPHLLSWAGGNACFVHHVLETWTERRRWWKPGPARTFYRLDTNRGLLECYREGDRWYLQRLDDRAA